MEVSVSRPSLHVRSWSPLCQRKAGSCYQSGNIQICRPAPSSQQQHFSVERNLIRPAAVQMLCCLWSNEAWEATRAEQSPAPELTFVNATPAESLGNLIAATIAIAASLEQFVVSLFIQLQVDVSARHQDIQSLHFHNTTAPATYVQQIFPVECDLYTMFSYKLLDFA